MRESRIAILLTLGVSLVYWSFVPGHAGGSLTDAAGIDREASIGQTIAEAPFGLAGAALDSSPFLQEVTSAMRPVAFSALIILIVFLWSCRLTKDPFASVGYAVVAAFCTMIWPYAYIGLEATQSLALLAAAFIALVLMPRSSLLLSVLLGMTSGIALTAERSSVFLLPAVAFLIIRAYAGEGRTGRSRQASAIVIAAVFVVGDWILRLSRGAPLSFIEGTLVSDPIAWAVQAVALIGSPGKGLIFYTPVVLVSAFAWRSAWTNDRPLVIFTALALAGLTGGLAMGSLWADQAWGPRHLHAVVAPLILMIAAARRRERQLRFEYRVSLVAAALIGFFFSLMGVLFHHEAQMRAAIAADRGTMQTIRMDPAWNHVKFNARLFRVWLTKDQGEEIYWRPELHWYYDRPAWAPEKMPAIPLSVHAVPMPRLARQGAGDPVGVSLLISLCTGVALVTYCAARSRATANQAREHDQ